MITPPDKAHALFPLWIELSGLPLHLNEKAKAPFAWAVLHKIIELDIAANPRQSGLLEIPLGELAERSGVDSQKVIKAIKAMRKLTLVRAFLPDNDQEPALLQVLTPLPTPRTPDEVRARHSDLFLETPWPPRYAIAVEEDDARQTNDANRKIKRVVDLYLNLFSMKLNSLILDQLQLISDRYELPLIEKVFERARKQDASSLGWILTEIRREMKLQAKASSNPPS